MQVINNEIVRWNMAKKGSREFIFEVDGIKTDYTNLKKLVEQELKTKGVKYTDNIQCYFNLSRLRSFCRGKTHCFRRNERKKTGG